MTLLTKQLTAVFMIPLVVLCYGHVMRRQMPSLMRSNEQQPLMNVGSDSNQTWNYVNVRQHAYMFWWLYYTSAKEGYKTKPLVIWLQGGPGSSSTGFGNFAEIGPLDQNLKERNTTWVSAASVLFIDNPVGTGFSYVTDSSAYAVNNEQIADDLLVLLTAFLNQLPDFKTIPLYIFSESYGGKMTATFSQVLYKAIASASLKCNFRGLAMGDSWISPVESTLSWAPYLLATSLVDKAGFDDVSHAAQMSADALARGDGKKATELWSNTENVISDVTGGVNVYNILDWSGAESLRNKLKEANDWMSRSYNLHVGITANDQLSALMNGPIRKKLGIIPDSVEWGGQSVNVFSALAEDFMKPVTDSVDYLLNSTNLKVVVYSGQLDMIVDTLGTEAWVSKLKWPGLPHYHKSVRNSFATKSQPFHPAGYVKSYKNFYFYWILDAGHMIPTDAGDAALEMLKKIIE